MLFSNRYYYYPDEQIVGFSMVFRLPSGVGGIWSLPHWWPLEKRWRRWLSSCIHSCLSPSCTQMWSLSKASRRSKALCILFPLYLTLAWVTLALLCICVPTLITRIILINRKESKVLCSQTKLSFIASALTYPCWRNVSTLKLAL